MKTLILLLFMVPIFLFGQDWKMQTPLKLGDYCTDAFVVDDTTAYASTLNGKLFRTINGGEHWTEAHHVLGYQINGTAWGVHFTDVNNGVIPTGNGRIFRTSNAGINWTEEYFDNTKTLYEVYFPSTDTGYVCGYPGTVLKTTDGGLNWNFISTGSSQELRDVWFTSNDTGCIISDQGDIIKTIDGGSNWVTVSNSNPDLTDIEFYDANNGIAVGFSGTILKTVDGGSNWNIVAAGVTIALRGIKYISSTEVLICGNDGIILRSTDGGNNFTSEGPTTFDDLSGFALFPNGRSVVVGDGVVYELDNGSAIWEMKYDEIPEAFFDRVMFTSSDTGHAVGHFEAGLGARAAIIKTANKGKLWTSSFASSSQSGNIYDLSFINSTTGFAGSNPSIRTTVDGGNSNWGSVNGPSGSNTAIHFFDQNTGVISCYQGLYKTIDGGSNWTLSQNMGTPGFQNRFWFLDNDTGYVCGTDVLKTYDGGDTWNYLGVPLGATLHAIHFPNDSVGYVVGDGGGLRTSDYGNTWTALVGPSALRDVYFPDAADPDSGYVLTYSGEVLKTLDGGQNWVTVIQAPWDKEFDSFWFVDDIIYAGGSWGDIFVSNINEQAPIVDFIADVTSITIGSTVNFTDLTTNYPTSWQWDFSGANQAGSIAQHPNGIQYDTLGCFPVTLKATNGYGADTLLKTCYINVIQNSYCTVNLTNGTVGGDFIDGVELDSIVNLNTGSTTGSSYTDYTSLSTTVEQNGNYSIQITSGSWTPDTYAAWIDYNINGIFESSEKLGEFVSSANFQTQTINFTVPIGATLGLSRLRVYGAYNATNVDPCTDYIWGEIEDYSITINPFTIGVKELENLNEIKVFPNPTASLINIITSLEVNQIEVIDIRGTLIKRIPGNVKVIDIHELPSAIYFIKISTADNITWKKIIKK